MKFHNNHDFITLFERRLSEFTGAPFVVLTDSCTNAIFLSLIYHSKHSFIPGRARFINIPKHTYISIPQAIINAGFAPFFTDEQWKGTYKLGEFPIIDAAVGLEENMYQKGTMQCLSFQQKKALNIGKGGAILLDNEDAYNELKRMSWDGRDSSIPVSRDNPIHGWHMNMIPDDAVKGVLILNNLSEHTLKYNIKKWSDYPDLSEIYKG